MLIISALHLSISLINFFAITHHIENNAIIKKTITDICIFVIACFGLRATQLKNSKTSRVYLALLAVFSIIFVSYLVISWA